MPRLHDSSLMELALTSQMRPSLGDRSLWASCFSYRLRSLALGLIQDMIFTYMMADKLANLRGRRDTPMRYRGVNGEAVFSFGWGGALYRYEILEGAE